MEAEMKSEQRIVEYSAADIAQMLSAKLIGDGNLRVNGVQVIERADESDLAFVGCSKNLRRVETSSARVVIAPENVEGQLADFPNKTFILVPEPEASFLQIAVKIVPTRQRPNLGISPHAVVADSSVVGAKTNVHALAVIGEDVRIGESCDIGPGAVIGDGCVLGDDVVIGPNAVLYRNVILGSDVVVQAGSVLGAEGFGYRTIDGRHQLLPHVGTVRVDDDVQIGANTTIDRAKMGATTIGSGTRIDNLVMIAHNCRLGRHNLIAGHTGIAGSTSSGDYVVCAGQAGIADHVHLGDGAIIGAKTGVHRDMQGGKAYLGIPARDAALHAREQMSLKRLPEMRTTVKKMEKQIAALEEQIARLTANLTDANSASAESRDAA